MCHVFYILRDFCKLRQLWRIFHFKIRCLWLGACHNLIISFLIKCCLACYRSCFNFLDMITTFLTISRWSQRGWGNASPLWFIVFTYLNDSFWNLSFLIISFIFINFIQILVHILKLGIFFKFLLFKCLFFLWNWRFICLFSFVAYLFGLQSMSQWVWRLLRHGPLFLESEINRITIRIRVPFAHLAGASLIFIIFQFRYNL